MNSYDYLPMPKTTLIIHLRARDSALHELANKVQPLAIENHTLKAKLAKIEEWLEESQNRLRELEEKPQGLVIFGG